MCKNRRSFIKNVAASTAAYAVGSQVFSTFGTNSNLFSGLNAKGQGLDNKFILYIHAGSWDGIASGLLQPNSTTSWPLGVFENGIVAQPRNPLLGQITKKGNMYLHKYNGVLAEVMDDLFHATLNSRSLGHEVAATLQSTGAESGHPSWTAGFAQLVRNPSKGPGLIAGLGGYARRLNGLTTQVSTVDAASVSSFVESFLDPFNSGASSNAKLAFGKIAREVYSQQLGTSSIPGHFKSNFENGNRYWAEGIPEFVSNSPLMSSINEAFSVQKANELIDKYMGTDDAQGVKDRYGNFSALRSNLILAAALAKSGRAYGMDIQLPGEDAHFGGSQVETARSGAQLFTQIALFWKWIVAEGLKDNVMVVITHEFSRTRFNTYETQVPMVVGGQQIMVTAPGTDHGLTAGMYLLHGKLPGGERLGGIIDSYVAAGSQSLSTPALASLPAPTSSSVLTTALMLCFPDIFKNPREPDSPRNMRTIFPQIEDSDVILPLLRAGT